MPSAQVHFSKALGYEFASTELLTQALTHRSFGASHYERLEFIGDAVLGLAVTQCLYTRLATSDEGELSRTRASLVRQENLVLYATKVGISDFLRLGSGELKSGGARRPSILADVFEALLGAIFLEAGFPVALRVVEALFADQLDALASSSSKAERHKDPKTALQEVQQARGKPVPRYVVIATTGPAHAQSFEVEVSLATGQSSRGQGASKRLAEQAAALSLLRTLGVVD